MAKTVSEALRRSVETLEGVRQKKREDLANQLAMQQLEQQMGMAPLEKRLKEAQAQEAEAKAKRLGGATGALGGMPANLAVKDYDEYGLPRSYYDPQAELGQKRKEEELKREFDLKKPLADTAAGRLEGAKQVMEQAGKIRGMVNPKNFGSMKNALSRIRMGQTTGITQPGSLRGAVANTLTLGLASEPFRTNDEEKAFELALNLIAENILRARTGAAAPEAEVKREAARALTADDTLESFLNRLSASEKYAGGLGESLRPGSMRRIGQESGNVPEWAAADPQAYLDAKSGDYPEEEIKGWFSRNGLLRP